MIAETSGREGAGVAEDATTLSFLSTADLQRWVRGLRERYTVIAPSEVDGVVLFARLDATADITVPFRNSLVPTKALLYPSTEVIFTVEKRDGQTQLIPPPEDREQIIFGVRPCDVRGITLLDQVLLADPADTLYARRRSQTILVGVGCSQPEPQCFCTTYDCAPDDGRNVDVFLREVEGGYGVKAVTSKGRSLLEGLNLPSYRGDPPVSPYPTPIPFDGVDEKVRTAFGTDFWARLADRCLGCKICTYLCPTCHCFDLRDWKAGDYVERIRTWDCCQSPGFTRLAGGHNPRATKAARLRQFYAHKFLYFPERFGSPMCVGCGRCLANCPVNIDVREVLSELQQAETGENQ